MTASATRRLSVEEWGDLDEDIEGELVDGALVEEEMPDFTHETAVTSPYGVVKTVPDVVVEVVSPTPRESAAPRGVITARTRGPSRAPWPSRG